MRTAIAIVLACAALAAAPLPIPNVEVVTHEGRRVRFYDDLIKDRVVLINFMFTTCRGICPRVTRTLLETRKLLGERVGKDVFLYSITLDPATDTPQVLKRYAESNGTGPGWTFLTGNPDNLELLRNRLGFRDPDPKVDADRTQHGAIVVFGNAKMDRWIALPAAAGAERIATALLRVIDPYTTPHLAAAR